MRLAKRTFLIVVAILLLLPAPLLYFGLAQPDSELGRRILQPRLHGVVLETVKPDFSWVAFADGSFQELYAKWFNQRFGLRELFIRLNNQLYYSLFDKSYMGDVLVGKNKQLYGRGHVDEYCGLRPPLEDAKQRALVRRMGVVQQQLEQRGVTFVVLITPNKPDMAPADLPDGYCAGRVHNSRNIDAMMPLMQAAGINFVDGPKLTLAAQKDTRLPLFSRGGLHWNALGASGSVNALLERIGQLRGLSAGGLVVAGLSVGHNPVGADKDLANVLNLIWPDDRYPSPQPRFELRRQDETKPLSVLMVGGSYSWLPLELIAKHRLLAVVNFHFYYRGQHVIYVDGREKKVAASTDIAKLDYPNYVLQHDAVVLEINAEAFSYSHVKDFLQDLGYNLQTADRALPPPTADTNMIWGPGWLDVEMVNGGERRWLDGSASIVLFGDRPRRVQFSFKATSFFRARKCRVYLNDQLVAATDFPAGPLTEFNWQAHLQRGANRLRIVTTPDGEAPATVTDSQDRRKLALLIQDFQVRFK